jgi:DNA uptake protein ComE-like DNA-binding protein
VPDFEDHMKFATSLFIAALALTPAMAFAKDKAMEKSAPAAMTTTPSKTMSTGSLQSKIDINTASENDLAGLLSKHENKTAAAKTAKAIVAGRTYASPEDLVTKKIVSKKTFASIKSKISVQ